MATAIIALGFFLAAVALGFSGDPIIVAHNVTVNITCTAPNGRILPTWFVNERTVLTSGYRYRSIISTGRELTAILTIDGNHINDTLNIHCEVYITEKQEFLPMHNTTLKIQGHLSSPKNVHINSSTIEWTPPYYEMNNDIIHVDPHITQYTVYITDNYTGDSIVEENVTETQYTFNTQEDDSCPMYQVSAWNAGGEGDLSEPVLESTPQVPHNVTTRSITAKVTVEPNVVYIHIDNVDVVCTSRMPEFFLITVLTSAGSVLKESNMTHDPGQAVANFTISLPQSVDVCTLHVRVGAGNSAGISAPSETVEVVYSGGITDSTTFTTTTTTVSTVTNTQSGSNASVHEPQQGVSTALIVIIVGGIAAVGGVLIVITTVGIVCYRKYICYKKDKLRKHKIGMHFNQAYETVTRGQPAMEVHTEPCPAYEVVVHTHH